MLKISALTPENSATPLYQQFSRDMLQQNHEAKAALLRMQQLIEQFERELERQDRTTAIHLEGSLGALRHAIIQSVNHLEGVVPSLSTVGRTFKSKNNQLEGLNPQEVKDQYGEDPSSHYKPGRDDAEIEYDRTRGV